MDYLSYWGLYRKPFAQDDNAFFFSGKPQREALAGLHYFVAGSWNSACLVAPDRSGATRLLQHLARMNGFGKIATEVIQTDGRQPTARSVIGQVAVAMKVHGDTVTQDSVVQDTVGQDPDTQDAVVQMIRAGADRNIRTVWLIDDCGPAAARVARDLVMACDELSVVMVVTPQTQVPIATTFGRCCMTVHLDPLDVADTILYVTTALQHAGSNRQLIDDAATVRLHELSGGCLADIASLAERALRQAASRKATRVCADTIESIGQPSQAA